MGANDGLVLGSAKIVDGGPDSLKWNLVILGDGYRHSEMHRFRQHAQDFVNELRSTPPFGDLFKGINVHRVDVASDESGADDPGCGGGLPTAAKTYFDCTFCSVFAGKPLERLLTIDVALALSVATKYVPLRHQVLCIVNSTKYGGSGGVISTCSVAPQANQIAIHELGHSAFALADEYGGNGAATPPGEPSAPNVTRNTDRHTNKWRAFVASSTPMPTECNPSCSPSNCQPPSVPAVASAIGTYEGAIYSNCSTYRPLHTCYMRDYGPFCPVCADVIKAVLSPFQ